MGLYIVILAGGSGTRLWPVSRSSLPKHLLPLARGGKTLLRDTVERVLPICDQVRVVTSQDQAQLCQEALSGLPLPNDAIIAEPTPRGTGPALALATAWIARQDPQAVICSVHADAYVDDPDAYRAAVWAAAGWASRNDALVAVGIKPRFAAPNLGWIQLNSSRENALWKPVSAEPTLTDQSASQLPAFTASFVEKPSAEVAEQFFISGKYLWNLGLFAWNAQFFIRKLQEADKDLARAINQVVEARSAGNETLAAQVYRQCKSIPVDNLLYEGESQIIAVQADFPWSDVGSWDDLSTVRSQSSDEAGNAVEGDGLVVEAKNSFVSAHGGRLVVLAGTEDLVVVDTEDAVLVIPKDKAQLVKSVVEQLRAQGRTDLV